MEYTKFDLEQRYRKLDAELSNLRRTSFILADVKYVSNQDKIVDAICEITSEIKKEMLRVKMEMMIFDIQDNAIEEMKEYIEVLDKAIDSI